MTSSTDDDAPSWMQFAGWSGADGELFLRADSVMDLATGFHELAALAEHHVTDLDKLSAVDAAARSRAAQMLPAELRETASQLFTNLTGGFQQELKAHLDALDPGTVGAIRDPFEWVLAQLTGLFGQGIETAQGALSELPVSDPKLFAYMMQLSLASERRPRLLTTDRPARHDYRLARDCAPLHTQLAMFCDLYRNGSAK